MRGNLVSFVFCDGILNNVTAICTDGEEWGISALLLQYKGNSLKHGIFV